MAGYDSGDSQDLFNIPGKINANDSLVSLIIKSCNEGIIIVQENQIEFVNNSFLSLTEYSQEEVFGKAFLDFIAPECRDEISVIHNDRISEESSLRIYETAFLTKSDEHVYVKVTASHFEYNGNPAVMVIFKDSSIRKENNDLTHSDTNFFDSIIEHSPNPMWVSDTCGNIIRINQALRDLMKITDEEIINNYNVLKDKQVEQQGYLDLVRKVFEEGIDAEFTLDYYTAREEQVSIQETTHRILEITLIPLKNSKGEITNVICLEKDITERVEATEALSESEEKYYLLFENTYDAILLTIPDGRIIAANPAACKMFGMTEEEICQSGRNGIVDLSDTRLTDAVKQRDDKGYFKGQLTFLRKDGSRFEGEVTSVIFNDSEGDPRSSMIIRDISEQNQAREELRIEKEKAESYLSIADIILLVIDENHLVSMINRKGCEILGYEHNEIIGTNWFDKYIPERYSEQVNDYWNRFRRGDGDGLTTFENPVITKNREERIIFWHNTILTDNKGKFSGTLSSGQDITEWKLSDESLKESEKKNSIFTELTSDYVYVYTRDEKGQMVLDWIGGAFEQTTGYTPEEFKTLPVASNVHPEDRPTLIDTQRKVMSGETTTLELRIIQKNGGIRWISNQAQPIWDDDHTTVIAIYGAAHDITTRKLVEQNLINTNRALTVLSRCNEVLVHSTDEWNLLNEVCRIVVESGGYLFTWVGYRENDPEKSISTIAANGMGTSYLESVNVTWSDTKLGRGPTGTAIRTGEYSIISNTQTDPDFKPWREKAMKNGFKSVVSLPLLDEGKAYGALTIYADSVNAFTLDEIKLLSEMTNNLSYGIISLRARLERDTAEQIIRENEQRLIDAQVMGRMGNWEYNVDTGETKWFEGMYELYNRDSSLGPPGREDNDRYYSREQQKLFVDFVQTAIENNKEITYDFEMTDENGHKKYCTASIRPVINEKREAYKIFGIVQDITEQRKAEEALSQSEEMLRLIIDSIPQGIMVTSLEGQLSRVNPSFLEFFGYDSEIEVIGKNALDFAVESDRERILDQVVMAREEKKQKTTEYTALKKDGSSFSAAVSVATLNDSTGKTTGFIGVIVDITERLKMQEQLIVTDRLASVGELAAGIAHELNNPLTGVVGFSDLLMGRDDIPLNIREDLNIINREASRASQVARHLLTFARRHPDEKTPVNVNSIITLVMELRSYEQRVNNIVSRLHLNRHIPDIMGNDFQLQQVFLNIIINAEYFMTEEHGKGILDITSDVVDDKVRITFKDDGPGISQENRTHIFNPFYTTKAVGKGTGLGLSICHGIITEHSGSLTAESEPGKGATFIIELPVYHRES